MTVQPVRSPSVRQSLKILFTGAVLIFLVTIFIGFLNALTPAQGDIPRWQSLLHLHSGALGWITLSAIGIAIWLLTGDRQVSAAYETSVRRLSWAAVLSFAAYVPFFGLSFSRTRPDDPLINFLPVFGSIALLVLWWAVIFAFQQLRQQAVLSAIQLLAAGALLVAGVGAIVGTLLGLEHALGSQFMNIAGNDRVAPHAAIMDTYLYLIAAAIIEWFTSADPYRRVNWAGWLQFLAWTAGSLIVPIGFLTNTVDILMPVFIALELIGVITFFARAGWGAVNKGLSTRDVGGWTFFGTVWLIIAVALFLYAGSILGAGGTTADLPVWFGGVFSHTTYVGVTTGLILAVLFVFTWQQRAVIPWGDRAALWLLQGGFLVFAVLKIAVDIRLGAMIMGLGALVGIYTAFMRLRAASA